MQQIHVRLPQTFNRADIFPVAVKRVGEHACAVSQHFRNQVVAEIVRRIFFHAVFFEVLFEERLRENVNAHRGEVRFGFFRFFLELRNATGFGVGDHDAETRCFFPRHFKDADCHVRIVRLVSFEHPVIIHRVDVVARKNQDVVGVGQVDEVEILVNRVGCPAIPIRAFFACVRRKDEHAAARAVEIPRAAAAEVVVQFERLILSEHANFLDARVCAI